MGRQTALLIFVTLTLGACTHAPLQQGSPAPVVELASGPGDKPPKAESNTKTAAIVAPIAAPPQSKGAYLEGDGPGADIPANLDSTPDAVPKAEPFHRYANRPYTALGKTYTPLLTTGNYTEVGLASWYGKKFQGQRTSIGEMYDMYAMSASHPILPIPSYARITNVATKKSIIVRINDRGPFLHDRIIDLSYAAAHKLGLLNNGVAEVQVESIAVENKEGLTVSSILTPPVKSVPLLVEAPQSVVKVPLSVPTQASAPVVASSFTTAETASAKPVLATTSVYLQLGAFKTIKSAKRFMAKMHAKLGSSGKSMIISPKNKLHQVLLGPYATPQLATATAKKLKAKFGIKTFVSMRK